MPEKLAKYPNVYDICPKKINKISEFYMIFALPEFYTKIVRKIFFSELGGGGTCPLPPPRLLRL